jgi:hypothetical protein
MSEGDQIFLDGILSDEPNISRDEKIKRVRYWQKKIKPPVSDSEIETYIEKK